MDRTARLNSLIEKVADAPAPSRELFAEVWFATTGKQHPDIKGRFAVLMHDRAWREAALVMVACALPGWRVVSTSRRGCGEALLLSPDHVGVVPDNPEAIVRHTGGASLAILVAMLQTAVSEGAKTDGQP